MTKYSKYNYLNKLEKNNFSCVEKPASEGEKKGEELEEK